MKNILTMSLDEQIKFRLNDVIKLIQQSNKIGHVNQSIKEIEEEAKLFIVRDFKKIQKQKEVMASFKNSKN